MKSSLQKKSTGVSPGPEFRPCPFKQVMGKVWEGFVKALPTIIAACLLVLIRQVFG